MSHQTNIGFEPAATPASIKALEQAATQLGCTLVKGGEGRVWGGRMQSAEYVIKVPNANFDILVNTQNKKLVMTTDFYDGSVEKALGNGMGRLKQEHAVAISIAQAKAKGLAVVRKVCGNGDIKLTVMGV